MKNINSQYTKQIHIAEIYRCLKKRKTGTIEKIYCRSNIAEGF